jgi:hypothetical protein
VMTIIRNRRMGKVFFIEADFWIFFKIREFMPILDCLRRIKTAF